MSRIHATLLAAVITITLPHAPTAQAATPQSLSATIDGKRFESDDPGILYLVPIKGVLNLMASTKGASAYPPPPTLTDRLSINCKNFDGQPRKWGAKEFGSAGCEVTFTQGVSRKPGGDPQAEYRVVDGGANAMEITSVKGKVIEGKFSFELIDRKTKRKLVITDGTFKAEDRQL